MPITSKSKFQKFNFTLYERLDTIREHIIQIFNTKSCPFLQLWFQFEANKKSLKPGKYHPQGLVKLRKDKQILLGSYDSLTKKGTGIKGYFEANLYVEFANGTNKECLAYTGKDYNQCNNPEHNPNSKKGQKCKCDFKDLSKICNCCTEKCIRTFARISEDPEVAGPFDFLYDEKSNQISKQYYTTVESNDGINTEFDSDPQIESSNRQNNYQYSEDSSVILEPVFELHSDDSDYIRTKKKGKFKEVIEPQVDNNNNIQRTIQSELSRI
ncbi:hypothetical protein C2G38_2045984 [Gigaspora rosea]|uniref:Uncharacterized protein n=1 Tax=Gigaspora rosea TaxID=44941 RepID=A0A397UFA6_9GLOM|nr:hypothetical protein C2G38_2045984 [Gigaspora rosea]